MLSAYCVVLLKGQVLFQSGLVRNKWNKILVWYLQSYTQSAQNKVQNQAWMHIEGVNI